LEKGSEIPKGLIAKHVLITTLNNAITINRIKGLYKVFFKEKRLGLQMLILMSFFIQK
jgi:hypothetical protein